MFTGLIQDVGRIVTIRRAARGARLTIRCALALGDVAIGDSIAVDGACLTMVARSSGDCFDADVSEETLARTKLGTARRGAPVNLELALRLGDRLGGHLVQGHVELLALHKLPDEVRPLLEDRHLAAAVRGGCSGRHGHQKEGDHPGFLGARGGAKLPQCWSIRHRKVNPHSDREEQAHPETAHVQVVETVAGRQGPGAIGVRVREGEP